MKQSNTISDDKESLLVDFVESELDDSSHKAMWLLMKHSALDRKIVGNLIKTRDTLRNHDSACVPSEASYFDSLHDKIMSRLEAPDAPAEVVQEPGKRAGVAAR